MNVRESPSHPLGNWIYWELKFPIAVTCERLQTLQFGATTFSRPYVQF